MRVHEKHAVFIKSNDLDDALAQAKSPQQFIKLLVEAVYTEAALCGSTAQGYPSRSGGERHMRNSVVLPRLHPDGRSAIIGKLLSCCVL